MRITRATIPTLLLLICASALMICTCEDALAKEVRLGVDQGLQLPLSTVKDLEFHRERIRTLEFHRQLHGSLVEPDQCALDGESSSWLDAALLRERWLLQRTSDAMRAAGAAAEGPSLSTSSWAMTFAGLWMALGRAATTSTHQGAMLAALAAGSLLCPSVRAIPEGELPHWNKMTMSWEATWMSVHQQGLKRGTPMLLSESPNQSLALIEEGSCAVSDVTFSTGSYASEVSWRIDDDEGNQLCAGSDYTTNSQDVVVTCCIPSGTITVTCLDDYGDGWNGAKLSIGSQDVCVSSASGDPFHGGSGGSAGDGRTHVQTLLTTPVPTSAPTPVPTSAPTFMHLSSTNLASGKPATQATSSGAIWAASGAVDGGTYTWGTNCNSVESEGTKPGSICTNRAEAVASLTATDPWWEVDMESNHAVKVVRVTGRQDSRRSDLLNITVSGQVCQDNVVAPWGWTLDLECNPEITGDKVKITLSGQRQLELAEVEVFTSNSPTPSTSPTSESCYDGVRYATAACAECTGPGPSQCISCDDDAVLVPFRANNHSSTNFTLAGFEGTCAEFTADPQLLTIPGAASEAASLMPSISTKWQEVKPNGVMVPGASSTGMGVVDLWVECYTYKVVWCQARTNTSQDQQCSVHKEGKLKSVRAMNFPALTLNNQANCNICTNAGGYAWNGCTSCGSKDSDLANHHGPPNDQLLDIVDLPSVNEACRDAIMLL